MSFENLFPTIIPTGKNELEDKILTKIQAYRIKNIDIIHKLYHEVQAVVKSKGRKNASFELEKRIHSHFTKKKQLDDQTILIQTVALSLYELAEWDPQEFEKQCNALEKLLFYEMDIGRMLPNPIDFSRKDWLKMNNMAKFEPITTIYMILFWGIIYGLIFYFFYS